MATKMTINWSKVKEKTSGKAPVDSRFWLPVPRADGGFDATIRFLPAPDHDLPWVEEVKHGFQPEGGQGKWFIEHCLRQFGEQCPICAAGWEMKQRSDRTGSEKDKELAKKMMKQEKYIVNILVIKDRQTPENEGKVFLWKFGREVMKKIMAAVNPSEESGDEPKLVFEPKEGTNFKVSLYSTKGGNNGKSYLKYENCRFMDSVVPLDDETIKYVEANVYDLVPFIEKARSEKKTGDELLAKLKQIQGGFTSNAFSSKTKATHIDDDNFEQGVDEKVAEEKQETFMDRSKGFVDDEPPRSKKVAQKAPVKEVDDEEQSEQSSSDEDDDDDFLKNIRAKARR